MTRTVASLPVIEKTVGPEWDGHQGNWDNDRFPITKVIIHTMDGTAQSADERFNNPLSEVSAHYGVLLDGSIWHWVDENKVAYHAGDYQVNQESIGIEHEDNGDYNGPRTPQLYETSSKLLADICLFYKIPFDRDHIRKHNEVSDKPTACPDSLDIDRILKGAIVFSRQNPGYLPTFAGQDVTNNGVHYQAFWDSNINFLAWTVIIPTIQPTQPETPISSENASTSQIPPQNAPVEVKLNWLQNLIHLFFSWLTNRQK